METKTISHTLDLLHTFSLEQRVEHVKNLHADDQWAQSILLGDEWANSITHGIGFILSLVGLFFLIDAAYLEENFSKQISYAIYGLSLVILYGASTCYHAFRSPKLKKVFRTVDHCAIYLLIAGSYTPVTMLVLEGIWGTAMLVAVWALAVLGVFLKVFFMNKIKAVSTSLYLLMGWLIVAAAEPLMERFHPSGLFWLISGGFFYTFGVVFFALDKRRFYHSIWHLFVLSGSACHYAAFFFYL